MKGRTARRSVEPPVSSESSEDQSPESAFAGPATQGFFIAARRNQAFDVADINRRKLKIRRTASAEPMSACDLQAAEAILARLTARRFARDHATLFGPHLTRAIRGPADDK